MVMAVEYRSLTHWDHTNGRLVRVTSNLLTCLLRNLYADQEATVRTEHGTDWFQIGKGVRQAVYCHAAYLTSMHSTS